MSNGGWLIWFAVMGAILLAIGAVLTRDRNPDRTAAAFVGTGMIFLAVSVLGMLGIGISAAIGRDLDGRFAGSPLHDWFESLRSGKGPCCSDADGTVISDADWESKNRHYRVFVAGAWRDVPDEAVITEPNRIGRTMVWPVYLRGPTEMHFDGIRCFMPGSMS